jgi:hypothetical protein
MSEGGRKQPVGLDSSSEKLPYDSSDQAHSQTPSSNNDQRKKPKSDSAATLMPVVGSAKKPIQPDFHPFNDLIEPKESKAREAKKIKAEAKRSKASRVGAEAKESQARTVAEAKEVDFHPFNDLIEPKESKAREAKKIKAEAKRSKASRVGAEAKESQARTVAEAKESQAKAVAEAKERAEDDSADKSSEVSWCSYNSWNHRVPHTGWTSGSSLAASDCGSHSPKKKLRRDFCYFDPTDFD